MLEASTQSENKGLRMIDGAKLKALRTGKGMTQPQLSVKIDTGETIISRLESNRDHEKYYTIKLIFDGV